MKWTENCSHNEILKPFHDAVYVTGCTVHKNTDFTTLMQRI